MSTVALVVDDEPQIRRLLRRTLEAEGYVVREASAGREALDIVITTRPDVVLLDLGLPDMDGLEVLSHLREWSEIPVVVVSVRDSDKEMALALDSGAEDFLSKPFSRLELLARLRAAMRKTQNHSETPVLTIGAITIDRAARRVTRAGEDVHLTPVEYALLQQFLKHLGRVMTHRQILRAVWGPKAEEHRLYLRVYVNHLRKKIEADPSSPALILNEHGIGYRMVLPKELEG